MASLRSEGSGAAPPTPSQRASLAAVIPTLNEETTLGGALADALREADEVIVSDGGSSDRTAAIAEAAGVPVVQGAPGRGPQLNRGAGAVTSALLLFLHADVRLAEGSGAAIREAAAAGAVGGGFTMRWEPSRPLLRVGERWINLRTRLTRTPLGDQAPFCTRAAFDALGGFRDWPILEDLDFARRLKRLGRVAIVDLPVASSARRLERLGVARTIATNWTIFALYFLGVPPPRLARLYRRGRR